MAKSLPYKRDGLLKERTGIQMLFILSLFTAVSGCMRLGIGLKDLTKGKILLQGVSKKRYFCDFLSYFSSRGRILLFYMCFRIRISIPFHLAIQKVSIQNLNCPKNACADMIFIPALRSED